MQRILLLIITIMAFSLPLQSTQASFETLYSFGGGTGMTTLTGGINTTSKASVVGAAWDYHDAKYFAYLGSLSATKNEYKQLRMLVGAGNNFFKFGSGITYLSTRFPTELKAWGTFSSDPKHPTDAEIIGIPLYLRWTPLNTDKWQIHLDTYYTIASQGELKIPVAGTGHPSGNFYLRTNALKSNGARGNTLTINYRVNKDVGLQLRCYKEKASINDQIATIPHDPVSALFPTKIDGFEFENKAVMLNVVLLH